MTNADKIMDALARKGPMCDTCLGEETGISPHQQVNNICHPGFAEALARGATKGVQKDL
jgi:hypothetical protein